MRIPYDLENTVLRISSSKELPIVLEHRCPETAAHHFPNTGSVWSGISYINRAYPENIPSLGVRKRARRREVPLIH